MSDPRVEIEHPLNIGQVYRDDRTDDLTKIIYIDDDITLLRDTDGHHRIEKRSSFDRDVGSGRFEFKPEGEFGYAGRMEALIDAQKQYESSDGRTAGHKAEALSESVSLLTEETPQFEEIPFADLSGVGAKTAARLVNQGYSTVEDISQASDEELQSVNGIGDANLQSIRDYVQSLK